MKADVEELLNQTRWRKERKKLRSLILSCGLDEDVKWGKLCYSYQDSKVVIIYGMKHYCALGFFKGALLDDDDNILVQPGKHSQAMRQLRFGSLNEITSREILIKDYIGKAIQAEKDGLEVAFDEKDNLGYPTELQDALDDDAEFAEAFDELTPGRQRGYVLYFSDAKQSKTRNSRIKKSRTKIMNGKGVNER